MKVYLTSGRSRWKIAEGTRIRLRLAAIAKLDPQMSDEHGGETQALFVDGKPVAFVNPWSTTEWVAGEWSGSGIGFGP